MADATRRDVLKATGAAVATATVGTRLSVRQVEATESGRPELTVDATMTSGSKVELAVVEHTDAGDDPVNEDTVDVEDGKNTYVLEDIGGSTDYYYDFGIGIGADDESPGIDSLLLEVPELAFTVHSDDDWSSDIDHDILFDEARLRKYQPALVMSQTTRRRFNGMYGYVAESDEEETFVCCYWGQMTHQDGLPIAQADSHLGDHEPIYVFVDDDSGEVDRVVYSGYHWFAAETTGEEGNLSTIRADKPTHINLRVVDPWHHYSHGDNGDGALVDLESWPGIRDTWRQNGFYEPAQPEAIEDPWTMLERDSWWRDGSTDAWFADLWRRVGLRGGSEADALRTEKSSSGWFDFSFDWTPFSDEDDS